MYSTVQCWYKVNLHKTIDQTNTLTLQLLPKTVRLLHQFQVQTYNFVLKFSCQKWKSNFLNLCKIRPLSPRQQPDLITQQHTLRSKWISALYWNIFGQKNVQKLLSNNLTTFSQLYHIITSSTNISERWEPSCWLLIFQLSCSHKILSCPDRTCRKYLYCVKLPLRHFFQNLICIGSIERSSWIISCCIFYWDFPIKKPQKALLDCLLIIKRGIPREHLNIIPRLQKGSMVPKMFPFLNGEYFVKSGIFQGTKNPSILCSLGTRNNYNLKDHGIKSSSSFFKILTYD